MVVAEINTPQVSDEEQPRWDVGQLVFGKVHVLKSIRMHQHSVFIYVGQIV